VTYPERFVVSMETEGSLSVLFFIVLFLSRKATKIVSKYHQLLFRGSRVCGVNYTGQIIYDVFYAVGQQNLVEVAIWEILWRVA